MNINSLRKNYDSLTMLQRLALADNALGRDDDGEALAIKNASPRIAYTQPDFCELLNEIIHIRLGNFIARLGYMMNFDFLLHIELEKLINKSSFKVEGRISNDLRLAGYLYVRATDSWSAINEELGLRSNFDEGIGQHLLAMWLFRAKDAAMREIAFSESEAMAFVAKKTKSSEFKTIEMETAEYREILGLKKGAN